ncbi:MAG: SDR family NAD(P)-dependent oxidoreductase [Bacteroidota bacterium]
MNKFIVVSGGTKGIGRAIIEKFASEGFSVATCARNKADLDELKQAIEKKHQGCQVHVQVADLSDNSQTESFVHFVNSLRQPVEVLVNNAGYFLPGLIHNEAPGTLESMIQTNLYSAYHLTRGLIGEMIQRRDGYVFTLCSTASIMAYPNGGSYCIAKHALLGMTKVLREEMKPHNIRVTAVLLGATLTASWEGVDLPAERFMKSEDVADAIFSAFSLSKNSVVEEILIRPQLGDI